VTAERPGTAALPRRTERVTTLELFFVVVAVASLVSVPGEAPAGRLSAAVAPPRMR
jgi:hypothetical protein